MGVPSGALVQALSLPQCLAGAGAGALAGAGAEADADGAGGGAQTKAEGSMRIGTASGRCLVDAPRPPHAVGTST